MTVDSYRYFQGEHFPLLFVCYEIEVDGLVRERHMVPSEAL